MTTNLTWKDRYRLALREEYTLKDIKSLCDCGPTKAKQIRDKAIEYALRNNLCLSSQKVPAEAVFKVTGHDINYFYDKMMLEHKLTLLEKEVQ